MRLIDADALYEEVTEKYSDIVAGCYPFNIVAYDMAEMVKNAPTVDEVPVVHAKWIAQNDALTRFMCSHCKSENHEGFETYCPKCGAKMDVR